jgi:hypothetical protein
MNVSFHKRPAKLAVVRRMTSAKLVCFVWRRVFGWQLAKADWRLKKESARQTPPKWLNYAGEKSE